jgi:hypothetical protein
MTAASAKTFLSISVIARALILSFRRALIYDFLKPMALLRRGRDGCRLSRCYTPVLKPISAGYTRWQGIMDLGIAVHGECCCKQHRRPFSPCIVGGNGER